MKRAIIDPVAHAMHRAISEAVAAIRVEEHHREAILGMYRYRMPVHVEAVHALDAILQGIAAPAPLPFPRAAWCQSLARTRSLRARLHAHLA